MSCNTSFRPYRKLCALSQTFGRQVPHGNQHIAHCVGAMNTCRTRPRSTQRGVRVLWLLLSHTSCTRAVSVMCALTFLLVATWLLARVLISTAWYWAGAHCSSAADDQWSMHCRLCTKTTIRNAPCIRAIHQRRFQRRVPVQIPNVERYVAIFKGISKEQLQHLTVEYYVDVPFQKTVFFQAECEMIILTSRRCYRVIQRCSFTLACSVSLARACGPQLSPSRCTNMTNNVTAGQNMFRNCLL